MIQNEAEWLATDDFRAMMWLPKMKDSTSQRKLMLLTVARLRRVGRYDPAVIDLIAKYANRQAKRNAAMAAVQATIPDGRIQAYSKFLFWQKSCHHGADLACAFAVDAADSRLQADRIRCVFGTPTWRASAAGQLSSSPLGRWRSS